MRADGAGEAKRLTSADSYYPRSFSADGKRLALDTSDGGNVNIVTAPVEGDTGHPRLGKPELFLEGKFIEVAPMFSPDGRWLAYMSNESGSFEIYVRPFPGPGGRWQISTGGGSYPTWPRGGQELFFVAGDQRLMAAGYKVAGGPFIPGKPRVWSDHRTMNLTASVAYDMGPDGRQAVVFSSDPQAEQKPVTEATFLLNFFDEVRRRVP
jgi:serine/threonine-protein kinase